MKTKTQLLLSLILSVAPAIFPAAAGAQIVAADFYTSTLSTPITSNMVVGAADGATAGWNSIDVTSSKPNGITLLDNTGAASGITLSVNPSGIAANGNATTYDSGNNTDWNPNSGGSLTNTQILFDGGIGTSNSSYWTTELSLTNIPYSSYNILVYISDDFNRSATVQLFTNGSAGTACNLAGGAPWYPADNLPTTYIQGTATSAGDYTNAANYVEFTGLSGDSQSVDINASTVSGFNGGIDYVSGIEVVNTASVPEPATWGSLALGFAAFLGCRRFRIRRSVA